MMERVTSDDTSITEPSVMFNKLPPWLVEMSENVKKLSNPEKEISFSTATYFSPDDLQISSEVYSAAPRVIKIKDDRTIDQPRRLSFAVEASNSGDGCVITQSSTSSSLPNTPKNGQNLSRALSAFPAFNLPDMNENGFSTLDEYLDKKDVEKSSDSNSGVKNHDHMYISSASKLLEPEHQRSYTILAKKPTEQFVTSHPTVNVQIKENGRSSRHQKPLNARLSRGRIPPHEGANAQLQCTAAEGRPNLPIGVIKRRQDYLAGVASREDIQTEGTDGNELRIDTKGLSRPSVSRLKNASDFQLIDKVAQLNLQASRKPNLTEIVKKSVQADVIRVENSPDPALSRYQRPLYHFERYPPRDDDDNVRHDFIVPELPRGAELIIDISTTWGDKHYVGLNGIEIFSDVGESVAICKIWADPTDINILPEYNNDPRVVRNLINGINQTTDDHNLWLAPYTSGNHHYIYMVFETTSCIAMIRIWNYNKSRIHSYRGVRDIVMKLDDVVIFDGEIARASGGVFGNVDSFGDTILFTTDEHILELISHHDVMYSFASGNTDSPMKEIDRPITTDTGGERPLTCASSNQSNLSNSSSNNFSYVCKEIELVLISNWGHPSLIGLSGIELIGDQDSAIPLTQATLHCSVGNENLHRLLDNNNLTTETNHMWAVYFSPGDTVTVTIAFKTEVFLTGVKIWNYNGSLELSYCGVKRLLIKLDGKSVSEYHDGFTLRRAPGCCHYDYVHEINFTDQSGVSESSKRNSVPLDALLKASICVNLDYEAPLMPQGFVYQVIIFSTWGDPYYVGLTGIEMYDSHGFCIQLTKDNIAAYPESVNVIEGVDNDVRTPDKLVDGVNDTTDGHHMWLAPILPNQTNRVYIIFDTCVTVSMIRFWNYKKTPHRGVKEFGILVDDLLVYNGILNNNVPYGTVLFTSNKDESADGYTIIENKNMGRDIKLLNFERRATSGGDCYADPLLRPHTSLMQANLRSNTASNIL